MKHILPILLLSAMCSGCTVITYDRVFPKVTWYWSKEAKAQRADQAQIELWRQQTNSVAK
jgi:hypothetical protein